MNIQEILKERDPTQGSIIKNIFLMTWPLWINSVIWIAFYALNIYWVSRLGPEAIAAVVAGGIGFMLLMTPIQGMVISVHGLIGNLAGKNDRAGLEKLVKEILSIGFILSLAIALLGYFCAPFLLQLLGTEEKVLSLAVSYLRIQALGGLITFSLWTVNAMIRAARDMMRPMVVVFIIIVLNGIFDWLLILGNLGLPRLGVAGAALSSVASAGIGTIIGLWILIKGSSPIKLNLRKWRDFKISFKTVKEIFGIASFDVLENSTRVIFDLILLRFVAMWGTMALAAYGIGQRLLKMSSMAGFDLATTTAIVTSNNLGAGMAKRAEKSAWIAVGLNALLMGIAALVFFVFSRQIFGVYSDELKVINIGINYLKITSIGYILLAAGTILRRAFGGAQKTIIPSLTSLFVFGGCQLGLAWALPKFFGLGVSGIWIAIAAGMIINGLILTILFKKGLWKPKEKK